MIWSHRTALEFSVLLLAMIGNAQIFGIDLALIVIAPVCIISLWIMNPTFSHSSFVLGLILSIIFLALSIISFQFNHSLGYWLWPLKALLLALLTSGTKQSISTVHLFLICAFVIVLFSTSNAVSGRAHGLFGPNMLYRFYGVLFFVGCAISTASITQQFLRIGAITLAIFAIITTGSTGGLFLLFIGAIIFFRPKVRSLFTIVVVSMVILLTWESIADLTIVNRSLSKMNIDTFSTSTRYLGWREILNFSFSVIGHEFITFQSLWTSSYFYPHNIFIELYSFFGLLGLLLIGIISWAGLVVFTNIRKSNVSLLELAFLSCFIGACFSGDLSDNYGVVGISIGILLRARKSSSNNQIDSQLSSGAISRGT